MLARAFGALSNTKAAESSGAAHHVSAKKTELRARFLLRTGTTPPELASLTEHFDNVMARSAILFDNRE